MIKIEENRTNLAKEILEEMNNLILADHQEKTEVKKELLRQDVERLKNKVVLLEKEKNDLEDKERALEQLFPYQSLSQQLSGSLFNLLDVREKLSAKKQEIENLYIQVDSLQRALEDIQPTKVVKNPTISENSIKPRPVLNMVIAAALGIFLGVFFALGKEWWERSESRI